LTSRSQSPHTSTRSENRIIVLLSGEPSTIPAAEATSLFHAYDPSASIQKLEDRILLAETTAEPEVIARRVAFARKVGLLIDGQESLRELRSIIGRARYRLRLIKTRPHDFDFESLGDELTRKLVGRVDLERPDYEVTVVSGNRTYLVLSQPETMNQHWVLRRPRIRPYFHPSALYPKLARAMVNLSRAVEGDVVFDPFVGTGSVLIEASLVRLNCLGLDISRSMLDGARRNLNKFAPEDIGLIRGDARRIPLKRIDTIVTDVPYGRASSSSGNSTETLVEAVLQEASERLANGKCAVIMHPATVPIKARRNLVVEEEHSIYVHRNLTRVITVLRRAAA
jgi:tRNA (guanine10-N2)-dimethyltransferase